MASHEKQRTPNPAPADRVISKPGIGRKLLQGTGHLAAGGVKGVVKTAAAAAKGTARYGAEKAHEKVHAAISQAEQDNASLEVAHKLERMGEIVVRKGFRKGVGMARDHRKKMGKKPANLGAMRKKTIKERVNLASDTATSNPAAPFIKETPIQDRVREKSSPLRFSGTTITTLATPTAQLGSMVDFGPKKPGLLSKGYHKGIDTGKRGLRFGSEKIAMQAHGQIDRHGGDNSSVKAVHEAEQFLERPTKYVLQKGTNLAVQPVQKISNKVRSAARHKYLVYKKAFLARHQSVAQARGVVMKAKAIARELMLKVKPVLTLLFVCLVIYAFCTMVVGPIAAALTKAGTEYIATTTYPVANQDITDSTAQWKELEMLLEQRIENIETEFPNYDEYRFDIDPMEHDPFELMSYLAATHLEFTHPQVQAEIAALFHEVNPLQLVEEIEIRYDADGDPYEWKILNVILKPKSFEEVVTPRLEAVDAKDLYEVYMGSGGNQQAFGNPFTFHWTNSVTSYYGYRKNPTGPGYEFHTGLDIAAPEGTPIRSVQNGTVVVAGWHNLYGNYAVIRNESGITTLYAHCLSLGVGVGDEVRQGQMIAAVGSTGNSNGNHLHIEVKIGDDRVNPLFYIQAYDESSLFPT